MKSVKLPKLLEKCQKAVNAYIRERDKELGCVCRGCNGRVENAGHYFSQGKHSGLRYHTMNIHGCCVRCNLWLNGNLIKYRQGLIDRYGEEYVNELENLEKNSVKKWTRIELDELIKKFK
jgi:hypothetical protein